MMQLSGKVGSKLQDPLMAEEETEEVQIQFATAVTKIQKLLSNIEVLT